MTKVVDFKPTNSNCSDTHTCCAKLSVLEKELAEHDHILKQHAKYICKVFDWSEKTLDWMEKITEMLQTYFNRDLENRFSTSEKKATTRYH